MYIEVDRPNATSTLCRSLKPSATGFCSFTAVTGVIWVENDVLRCDLGGLRFEQKLQTSLLSSIEACRARSRRADGIGLNIEVDMLPLKFLEL